MMIKVFLNQDLILLNLQHIIIFIESRPAHYMSFGNILNR